MLSMIAGFQLSFDFHRRMFCGYFPMLFLLVFQLSFDFYLISVNHYLDNREMLMQFQLSFDFYEELRNYAYRAISVASFNYLLISTMCMLDVAIGDERAKFQLSFDFYPSTYARYPWRVMLYDLNEYLIGAWGFQLSFDFYWEFDEVELDQFFGGFQLSFDFYRSCVSLSWLFKFFFGFLQDGELLSQPTLHSYISLYGSSARRSSR